ncbi:MAG: hypothetical protein MNSN_08170 [Minisyncoccus archaeiphilus]|uniref:adenine-specific methyltransferase EcoRI family protein n=1 Tax=Minisyncoccus archaeiphilus TaxID=3238481 RepID=UPI002B0AA33F|nr:MAG: hypothetical protein MNSN_08170 [Candidatus Parcubacteria bacterium]
MEKKVLNSNLKNAKNSKKDEFYTQLTDIEKELRHYKDQFYNKVVYCNCDDPFESNFFKYFANNFNVLKLKKLITTSYVKSPIINNQLPLLEIEGLKPSGKEPFKIEINEVLDNNVDGAIDLADVEWLLRHDANTATPLKATGDFRSDECIELLKEADIIVTNPPFSLFRQYLAQLIEYGKFFLILGDQNAITYKETFKLIKENKVWFGYDNGGTKWFQVPDDYDIPTETRKKTVNGVKFFSMGRIMWYTNLETTKRHEELILYKKYTPVDYPEYSNYKAINIDRVSDIPMDYRGVMGVPITFLDKYNPDQFEIVGQTHSGDNSIEVESLRTDSVHRHRGIVHGENKEKYARILIKNKRIA